MVNVYFDFLSIYEPILLVMYNPHFLDFFFLSIIYDNSYKIHPSYFSHFFSHLLSSINIENFIFSKSSNYITYLLQLQFISTLLKMKLTLSHNRSLSFKWFLFWTFFSYQRTKNFITHSNLFNIICKLSFRKSKSRSVFLYLCMVGIMISIRLRPQLSSSNNLCLLIINKAT